MSCNSNCPECGGVGLVRLDVPVGHPDFGHLVPCTNLDRKKLPHYTRSGLHKSELDLTWKDVWDLDNIKDGIQSVKMALDLGYGLLFLHGTWGNGKSLLLKVATSLALANNQQASYVNMSDIVKAMQDSEFNPDGDNAKGDLTYWVNCKVLAIDEFDKVRDTEYAVEKRFRLFDTRYVMATRMQNVTILASNTPPEEFTGEIHSRLNDGRAKIIKLVGKDVRPAMEYPETEDE